MKVAIPVEETCQSSAVCISFGRTSWFMIRDTETDAVEYLENAAAHSQGGAGIQAAQALVDAGVSVLLTPRCGENAAQVLKPADIRIYKTRGGAAEDNYRAYLSGELSVLEEVHAGFHGHGGH